MTSQENLGDVILPSNTNVIVNHGPTEYISVNQSDSPSVGYVSGEELRNLPQLRSSESSHPSSSEASSLQATCSMSQPLLGHSRTRPKYRSANSHHSNDSTV